MDDTDTLACNLADRIRRQIVEDGLEEGAPFMTEAEVSARHGVSRSITREAVSRLRALGILTSRQRKGLLVGRSDAVALMAQAFPFTGTDDEHRRRIGQMRYVLEMGAVDLAVANATEAQVQQLNAIANEYATAAREGSPEADTRIELAFHTMLLEMTGNPLVAGMHQVISEYFQTLTVSSTRELIRQSTQSAWDHHAIASAIAHRDIGLTRALLHRHLAVLIG